MRAFEAYTRRQVSSLRFGRKLVNSVVDMVATGMISGSWVGNLSTRFLLEEGRCNVPHFPKMRDEEGFPPKPR